MYVFLYLHLHVITERWHLTVNGVHNVWEVSRTVAGILKRSLRTDSLLENMKLKKNGQVWQTKQNNHSIGSFSLLLWLNLVPVQQKTVKIASSKNR